MLGEIARANNVTSYLEVGARNGVSVRRIAQFMPKGSRIVIVDLPDGPWGTGESESSLKFVVRELTEFGYDVHLFLGDSKAPGIVAEVQRLGPYDLAYIDGDHTYKGVSADWQNYGPMADIVAFDDILATGKKFGSGANHGKRWQFGTATLWEEMVADERFDIRNLRGSETSKQGIGVVMNAARGIKIKVPAEPVEAE